MALLCDVSDVTDAVSDTSRLLLFTLFAVCLSGCQSVRGMLKPYVCDCAAGASAQSCPTPSDEGELRAKSALALSHDAAATALERAEAEATLAAQSGAPSMRTLDRKGQREPQADPLELVKVGVSEAWVDTTDTAKTDLLQETFGVALPEDDNAVVLTGNFSKMPGKEMVVVRPGEYLSFYGSENRIARLHLDGRQTSQAFADLGVDAERATAQAVRLVQDGTLQVLMHWREENDAGEVAYKVGLYKVIGSFVGRLFERTLAVDDAQSGELIRRGAYEVLRGDSHRFIRWIPADDSGQLLTEQAVVLQWNRWEGVYRTPKPVPTAPKHDKLQSKNGTSLEYEALVRR